MVQQMEIFQAIGLKVENGKNVVTKLTAGGATVTFVLLRFPKHMNVQMTVFFCHPYKR